MKRRSLVRAVAATVALAACGGGGGGGNTTSTPRKATVELANGRSFVIALRPDKAPQTVERFAGKAKSGFYDNLTFHRVEDWVVQGGDPSGNGMGGKEVGSEYNDLTFKIGACGIARGQDPAINNDSQFFVVKKDSTFLDKAYTNFGQIAEGMDVVNAVKIGDKIRTIRIE